MTFLKLWIVTESKYLLYIIKIMMSNVSFHMLYHIFTIQKSNMGERKSRLSNWKFLQAVGFFEYEWKCSHVKI